ncbi:MAG: hypothetical protein V1876_02895, partial [Candidatus Peregrinibacteria bacterium]
QCVEQDLLRIARPTTACMTPECTNPYASPLCDEETPPQNPVKIELFPRSFLHHPLTVEQYDAWTKGWTRAELRRTIEGARMSELEQDGPYHHLVLSFSRTQKQQGDFSWTGTADLYGVGDLVWHPDGTITGREYGNYPWPRYRLIPMENRLVTLTRNLLVVIYTIRQKWRMKAEMNAAPDQ